MMPITDPPMDTAENKLMIAHKNRSELKDFLISFMSPTFIGKGFILYFGLNYTNYPGEGYGYGLAVAIAFTVTMLARFIWKYRNYEDL